MFVINDDDTSDRIGDDNRGQAQATTETFTTIASNEDDLCGIRTDETIACWGMNDTGQANAPHGQLSSVDGTNSWVRNSNGWRIALLRTRKAGARGLAQWHQLACG